MNQSQMLLILGALVMFSFLTLNAHRTVLIASQMRMDSEYVITAAEVAESMINEVKNKAFDEQTVAQDIFSENELSAVLGPDSGETPSTYDDIDDYITDGEINTARIISTPRVGSYNVSITVVYVNPAAPGQVTVSATRMKRIRVTVSSARLLIPLRLDYFASY